MYTMDTTAPSAAAGHDRAAATFRKIKLLVGGYLGVSALAMIAIVLLRQHPAEVNSAVWTRGAFAAGSGVAAFAVAALAARGSRGAYWRLRIISAVVVVAITLIIALPDGFPLWMKAEQGVAGLLMAGVAVLVNGRHLRSLFAAK